MVQLVDFSNAFQGINGALDSFGKQNEQAWQRQRLADLGQSIQGGDYSAAAQKAFAAGDPGTGIGLLELGQKATQLKAQQAWQSQLPGALGGAPDLSIGGLAPAAPQAGAPQASGPKMPSMVRSDPSSPAYVPPASARTVYDGLLQRGLSPIAAAGIAGNIGGESSFNTGAIGDNGTSIGLAQWRNERASALRQLAASQGKDWRDPNVQLDYLVQELKGPEAKAYAALQSAQNPQHAAELFMRHFERPSDEAMRQSLPRRSAMAAGFYRAYGGASTPTNVAVAPALAGVASSPDASAQASGAPTQLGSTGARGFTNPLPGSDAPAMQPPAGVGSAPLPPARPPELGGVQVASSDPSFAPQMPPPADTKPAWYNPQQAGAPSAQPLQQVAQAAPQPPIVQGSPATADPRYAQAANNIFRMLLTAPPGTNPSVIAALTKRYEEYSGFPAKQLEYQMNQYKLMEAQRSAANAPLETENKQLSNRKLRQEIEGTGPTAIERDVGARGRVAEQLGIQPGSPAYQSYVGTGKMPREDQQPLTATDKKAIMEADEGVMAANTAISALQEAKQLSPQALGGWGAGTKAAVANNLPDWMVPDFVASPEAAEATTNLDNLVQTNALSQLKAIFGAAPTEGERKILLDIQGSSNQPDKIRQQIYDRAIQLAERRLAFNKQRSDELRGGTFYGAAGAPRLQRQQGAPAPAAAQQPAGGPVQVNTPEEAMALPPGTTFVTPDGRVKVR